MIGSPHIFLTHNSYMALALNSLMQELRPAMPCCFIDVDSFLCLDDITSALHSANASNQHAFFILTGKNVCSEVLADIAAFRLINPFSMSDPLRVFLDNIKNHRGRSYSDIIARINAYHHLSMLTIREQQQFRLFAKYRNILFISDLLNLSPKTLYSRERIMARKLGLSGTMQLRYFIQSEMRCLKEKIF